MHFIEAALTYLWNMGIFFIVVIAITWLGVKIRELNAMYSPPNTPEPPTKPAQRARPRPNTRRRVDPLRSVERGLYRAEKVTRFLGRLAHTPRNK